jgi:hypothetical protein
MERNNRIIWLKKFSGLLLFFTVFLLISLRASHSALSPNELLITNHTNSLKETIAWARADVASPFVYLVTYLFKNIANSNIFLLRLPEIIAGAFSSLLFFLIIRNLNYSRPFLLSLTASLFLVLLNFAGKIGPAVWLALGTMLLLYLSFAVFLSKKEVSFYSIAALSATFLVLPMVSFISLFVIAILDIVFIIILLFGKKLFLIFYLLLFNLFAGIHFIPWGDVVVKFFVQNFSSLKKPNPNINWFGSHPLLGWVLVIITSICVIYLVWQLIKRRAKGNLTPFNIFALLNLIFFVVFLTVILFLPPLWPLMQTNYPLLFWPWWFLILSTLQLFLKHEE